jgi:hypothetical protein
MTLEEYRLKVVQRLRACDDSVAARGVLAEVDLKLMHNRMNPSRQERFWRNLHGDLDNLTDQARLLDKSAAAKINAIAIAAQAWMARNHLYDVTGRIDLKQPN